MRYTVTLLLLVLLCGCTGGPADDLAANATAAGEDARDGVNRFANETLPLRVAEHEPLDLSSVESFGHYQQFCNETNVLVDEMNREFDLGMPRMEPTLEGWEKAAVTIQEYGPLIHTHNELIDSARAYKREPTEANLERFYRVSGRFALETTLVSGLVFSVPGITIIRVGYHATKVNRFDWDRSSSITRMLSEARDTTKEVLVETSQTPADEVIEGILEMAKEQDGIEASFDDLNESLGDLKDELVSGLDDVRRQAAEITDG
ncbi:MAG: hypothetical protein QF415_08960 [Candidatus Undinarchaeales archaeon]|jgi:hypothetical protein|nr:hypothetical protein [Candidatus Undinarchaeales archaeon]MDP7494093.1 hypothetical protein [Candidatus Undinarchaeales archaeon]